MKDNPAVYVVTKEDMPDDYEVAEVFYQEAEANRYVDSRPYDYYRITRIQTK
jgi:hypothetical protein